MSTRGSTATTVMGGVRNPTRVKRAFWLSGGTNRNSTPYPMYGQPTSIAARTPRPGGRVRGTRGQDGRPARHGQGPYASHRLREREVGEAGAQDHQAAALAGHAVQELAGQAVQELAGRGPLREHRLVAEQDGGLEEEAAAVQPGHEDRGRHDSLTHDAVAAASAAEGALEDVRHDGLEAQERGHP